MTAMSIRLVGDPVLRQPASPVRTFDAELRALVRDLRDTLQKVGGAGLAAPQIERLLAVVRDAAWSGNGDVLVRKSPH